MKYKSQHFVPQCYMRPFSIGCNQRSIALYNLARDIFVENAGIRKQCSRDYFYDRTEDLDKIFNGWEGKYSAIVRKLLERHTAAEADLHFLRYFAYLQYLRTEAMAKHQANVVSDMRDFAFEGDPEGMEWATIDPSTIPKESLRNFLATMPFLADLHDCLIINRTKLPFITSGNPCVIVNRFHVQKLRKKRGGAGLLNSGCMLVLPVSPDITFVSYDNGVYSAPMDGNKTISVRRTRDVDALNALQALRASENIYFHTCGKKDYVRSLASSYKPCRPPAWHKWHFAVEETGSNSDSIRTFRTVKTPAEFRTANGLMHMESISVDPGVWCSLFSFRAKPRLYDTQSALGFVRSKELLELERTLRGSPAGVEIPRRDRKLA